MKVIEKVEQLRKLEHRAESIRLALESCGSSDEMREALEDMGFTKYTYISDEVYKGDDMDHAIKGIARSFTKITRVDEALGVRDEIDGESGVIRVVSTDGLTTGAIKVLSPSTVKMVWGI